MNSCYAVVRHNLTYSKLEIHENNLGAKPLCNCIFNNPEIPIFQWIYLFLWICVFLIDTATWAPSTDCDKLQEQMLDSALQQNLLTKQLTNKMLYQKFLSMFINELP